MSQNNFAVAWEASTFGGGPVAHRSAFVGATCDAIIADLDAEAQARAAQRDGALDQIAACAAALHTLSVGVDEVLAEIDGAVRNGFAVDALRVEGRLRKARADALAITEGAAPVNFERGGE